MCGRERARKRERERERGKGEEIQKGGTEWKRRERDIVRRCRSKEELLPVIQLQTERQTAHFPPAASIHSGNPSFKQPGWKCRRQRKGVAYQQRSGRQAEGKPVDVFKSLLI